MTEEEKRDHIVATAREWLGTPFHHVAGIKGVGVDCAHFLAKIYEEAGIIEPLKIEPYSPQWFLHRDEEKFMGYVFQAGGVEIEESEAKRGDVVLYKIGRCYAHGAIIIDWPTEIIHAYMPAERVTTLGGMDGDLAGKPRKFFTLFRNAE